MKRFFKYGAHFVGVCLLLLAPFFLSYYSVATYEDYQNYVITNATMISYSYEQVPPRDDAWFFVFDFEYVYYNETFIKKGYLDTVEADNFAEAQKRFLESYNSSFLVYFPHDNPLDCNVYTGNSLGHIFWITLFFVLTIIAIPVILCFLARCFQNCNAECPTTFKECCCAGSHDEESSDNVREQQPLLCEEPRLSKPEATQKDGEQCVVCLNMKKSHFFVKCRHLCVCSTCSTEIMRKDKRCPLCRQVSDSVAFVYM